MVDTRTSHQRSRIMRAVGTKNTGPEIAVRKLLHGAGYRYGLHRKDLPGSPDIVLARHRKVVFVHGCFWHGHGCKKGKLPKSRKSYWSGKIAGNKLRDKKRLAELRRLNWSALVVWQCQTKAPDKLLSKLRRFVDQERIGPTCS